jgi:hypothetical protein
MRIIVNDSSALIDLKKGGLLEIFLGLPFTLVVSDDLLADELLSFTKAEIALMRRKMSVASLNGDEMELVARTQREAPALSLHDCAAFVLAQREDGGILLTGDRRLRAKAEGAEIECHGVLWAVEQIAAAKLATSKTLIKTLEAWRDDSTVRLPLAELTQLIGRLKR